MSKDAKHNSPLAFTTTVLIIITLTQTAITGGPGGSKAYGTRQQTR